MDRPGHAGRGDRSGGPVAGSDACSSEQSPRSARACPNEILPSATMRGCGVWEPSGETSDGFNTDAVAVENSPKSDPGTVVFFSNCNHFGVGILRRVRGIVRVDLRLRLSEA